VAGRRYPIPQRAGCGWGVRSDRFSPQSPANRKTASGAPRAGESNLSGKLSGSSSWGAGPRLAAVEIRVLPSGCWDPGAAACVETRGSGRRGGRGTHRIPATGYPTRPERLAEGLGSRQVVGGVSSRPAARRPSSNRGSRAEEGDDSDSKWVRGGWMSVGSCRVDSRYRTHDLTCCPGPTWQWQRAP
jgi:hypothetical protein